MAEIIAKFDTLSKSLNVTMDGKELENIDSVSISKAYFDRDGDGDEDDADYYLTVCQVEPKKEEGHTVVTRIVASQSPEGESSSSPECPELPGYKKVVSTQANRRVSPVSRHIADYFGVK